MSNRKKARLVAIISLFTIPGLHRFYIGDSPGAILVLLSSFILVGYFLILGDIFRFNSLSDQEFDARYTVGFNFKMEAVNFPQLLTILAVILIMTGGAGLFFKERVLCFPEALVKPCILVTEGDNILNAKGIEISRELASFIQNFPPYLLGFGGIFMLGAILKSGNRTP
ncbi:MULTISPECIES: hypothetical protein [unclassified Microcoleus]|uniref:hypothetical protein n=1 Tax=unclassified Microcoleus TaxID=2642155 RepID=UPI002FD09A01